MPTRILLEARPGAGKTTAIRRLAGLLGAGEVSGFTTEEIRQRGSRVGFALETLGGERGVLAHVDFPGPPRVGRYGVDLRVMAELAVPALRLPGRVVLIDELGQMELAFEPFRAAVRAVFDAEVAVVATVHARSHPFTDALKHRPDIELVHLTVANRDALPERLAARLGGG